MFFMGTSRPRLDDKFRLTLPAKFRSDFLAGAVLTPGQDGCLYVYPLPTFERMYEQMMENLPSGPEARNYMRIMFANADQQVPDKQGRITIAPNLREYAHLSKGVAVIGTGPRLEMWDEQTWDDFNATEGPRYSESTRDLNSFR